MPIFASDSFLIPTLPEIGLTLPHVDDFGGASFENSNNNLLDQYELETDPIPALKGYDAGRKPGRLLFDLGDGNGGLRTQLNRCIFCNASIPTNNYEAVLDLWIDPSTMVGEVLIALRAADGVTPSDLSLAGMRFEIGGGVISVSYAQANGTVVGGSNLVPLGDLPMAAGYRKFRFAARIETVGPDVQVTAFIDDAMVFTPQTVDPAIVLVLGDQMPFGEVYFVVGLQSDGTVPVGSPDLLGPFSRIEVGHYAVGSIGSLGARHHVLTTVPGNFSWNGMPEDPYFPLRLPLPLGLGLPPGMGVMLDPDPSFDNADDAEGGFLPLPLGVGDATHPISGGGGGGGGGGSGNWSFHITLPMLKVRMRVSTGRLMRFNVQLPLPYVTAYFGSKNNILLPKLQVAMGITIPNNMRFHAVLPALTAVDDHDPATLYDPVWHGSVGFVWQFAIALPGPISTTMRISNWRFHVTLPMLTSPQDGPSNVDAHGCPICGGDVLTNLSIHVKLPKLKAHGEFTAPVTGLRAFVVLPALAMSHGLAGAVLLPSLRASARLSWTTDALGAPATALRRGWAMNLQNIAVTEFSGFEFRAMGRAYDQHFAVGLDGGLYRMGGDTDDGAPIAWAWESGLADFGMAAQKGLLALYVDGHFANSAVFSIQSDVARRIYGHRAKGYLFNHQPHRIPLGRGVRTHGIGIGMADESGGYLELDRITPEYTITSRNI